MAVARLLKKIVYYRWRGLGRRAKCGSDAKAANPFARYQLRAAKCISARRMRRGILVVRNPRRAGAARPDHRLLLAILTSGAGPSRRDGSHAPSVGEPDHYEWSSGLLKRATASMARSRTFAGFVGLLERLDREGRDLLRVLTYHRVEWDDANPAPSPALTISPDAFAEQMRFVHRRYHVVTVEQVIHAVQAGGGLPRRSVLITFDDGYQDFRSHAWPVLKELGLPVVLFVPTAFPGEQKEGFWWDRLHHALMNTSRRDGLETPVGRLPLRTARERKDASARLQAHAKRMRHAEALVWVRATCRELGVPPPPPAILSWGELRELASEGVTIGSHTRTHPLLTRIPAEEVRAELAGALHDLKRELGTVLPILAYPAGAFDDRVVRILEEESHLLAFTTVRGVNDLARAHPLKLRRIFVGPRTSLALLRAQLIGRSVGLNLEMPRFT